MKLQWNMNMKYSWKQCGNDKQIESELSHECETTGNQAEGLCGN